MRVHAGVFIGCAICLVERFTSHFLSGVLLFDATVSWSLLYNSFFFVDFAIAMAGAAALLLSKNFNAFMRTQLIRSKEGQAKKLS